MPDLKELLSELQVTDTLLQSLEKELEAIPAEVSALEGAIAELDKRFQDTQAALTEDKKNLKLAELTLTEKEEQIARYNSQLYSAKTNEEYKAFLKEIEAAQRMKSEAEDQIIAIMERIEEEEAQLKEREQEKDTQAETFRKQIEKVKASQAELDEKIIIARDKYERLRGEISKDILATYDRIKEKKEGIAAAHVLEGNRCSACLNPVPDQNAIEAEHADHLVFCEYCGRILLP